MKILFIRNTAIGTFHSPAADYQPGLIAEHGHSVTLIGRTGGSSDFLSARGVRTVEVEPGASLMQAAEQPDIVHVFHQDNFYPYPLRLRSVCNAKYVLDIRSPLLVASIKRYWYKLRHGMIARLYDVVVSHGLESAWTHIGKHKALIETGIGVELAAIPSRIRQAEPQSPISAVYIGSISEGRGSLDLIEAVRLASKKIDIRFDIYGAASQDFIARAFAKNASDIIQFCGLLPRRELFQRLVDYEMAFSYIPKALYDPAPPLKTLEYLAAGLPVIATNTRGNARYITHEQNGLLAQDNVNAFAEAIVRLAEDHALRHKLSQNSRPSVESEDWNHVVQDRLLPVYQQLLGTSGAHGARRHTSGTQSADA
jgi:glycosyltransferase involved in cell wall biosynthesis